MIVFKHGDYLAPEVDILYISVEEGFLNSTDLSTGVGLGVGEWLDDEEEYGGSAH